MAPGEPLLSTLAVRARLACSGLSAFTPTAGAHDDNVDANAEARNRQPASRRNIPCGAFVIVRNGQPFDKPNPYQRRAKKSDFGRDACSHLIRQTSRLQPYEGE